MPYSIVTSKGQTTIPKVIRFFLRIKPLDKVVYVIDNGKVVLQPVSGDILQLRGAIKASRGAADFKRLRERAKKKVARKALKELS